MRVRDRTLWPDETQPLLDVHLPQQALDSVSRSARFTISALTPLIRGAVELALEDVPDRDRICPYCRTPYEGGV